MNIKQTKTLLLISTIALGGLCLLKTSSIKLNPTNTKELLEINTLKELPNFTTLVSDLALNKNNHVENYLNKSLPRGYDLNILEDDNYTNYNVTIENTNLNVRFNKSLKSATSIEYFVQNSLNVEDGYLLISYTSPLKKILTEDEISSLSEIDQNRVDKPTITSIIDTTNFEQYKRFIEIVTTKSPIFLKLDVIAEKIYRGRELTSINEINELLEMKESKIYETEEYSHDCIIKTKTYEFKKDEDTLHVAINLDTDKVWAVSYSGEYDTSKVWITIKDEPSVNSGDKVKYNLQVSYTSTDNIDNIVKFIDRVV